MSIKNNENDKVISFKTADEFIKNNNENSKEENNINIYDINKIQKEKKINWSVSVYKSVDKEMTKFMKSKRWTRANALDYILNDWFKKH